MLSIIELRREQLAIQENKLRAEQRTNKAILIVSLFMAGFIGLAFILNSQGLINLI